MSQKNVLRNDAEHHLRTSYKMYRFKLRGKYCLENQTRLTDKPIINKRAEINISGSQPYGGWKFTFIFYSKRAIAQKVKSWSRIM